MNDQNDDPASELNSDGELSEDSLFEWDGDSWESVEHDPFHGYDKPQKWVDPAEERNRDGRDPRSQSRINYKVVVVVLVVLVAVVLLILNTRQASSPPVTATVSPTPTNTPSPTAIAPTQSSFATPTGPREVIAFNIGAFPSSGNAVRATPMTLWFA